MHVQPGSTVHDDEQPSPEIALPSSQLSWGNFSPSPQTAVQVPPGALGLDRARRRAAVIGDEVAVVALLEALLDPVAALGRVADRLAVTAPRTQTPASSVQLEEQPSPLDRVAVVALLVARQDAIAALLGDARRARGRARPAGFDLAGETAAVAAGGVAVITRLVAWTLPSPHT